MTVFDWKGFAAMWVAYVEAAIERNLSALREQHVYVIVFYQGYAEANGRIDGYSVGLNTIEALTADDSDGSELLSARWSPPEWRSDLAELDAPGADNVRFYKALTALACSSTRAHWYATYERSEAAMIDAARQLTRRATKKQGIFAKVSVTPDFVVFVHDSSREGPAKARGSIPPTLFARLFPNLVAHEKERARIAKLPVTKRVAYYLSRFGEYGGPVSTEDAERELAAIGAKAVLPLTRAIDSQHGDIAARVLGAIGAPRAAFAAKSLLAHVAEESARGLWCANTLGSLGRIDLLEPLARAPATRRRGIEGLVAARPASYAVLDALLTEQLGTGDIAEQLRPGSSAYKPGPRSFPLLAAAARSEHATIRMDVACALGDDSLGKMRPRALALLVTMLGDRSTDVQRLAALALGRFGALGAPAVASLTTFARSDAPAKVREAATSSLGKLRLSGVT